ncbi:MAG: diphosphomevalonate decarboxylase [Pseudomonadales bacterium]|nr:diphosphomevalonate decarboxylase [Pseudomonadales bacterium]NIX09407.1 diphosphomevalonate decarboxylase [Pseudomonadales bacterium]
MSTTARAHPNIALIKYWGKAPGEGNIPATPSLSITLDSLVTETHVTTGPSQDQLYFDDEPVADRKVLDWLEALRQRLDIPPLEIRTGNNFPTAAGLASSASGFAALIMAIDAHCGLHLDQATLSDLARRASGSAARSMLGGFVAIREPDWVAEPVLGPEAWPMKTVIAVTTTARKSVPSSQGMAISAATSPYYPAWVESTRADFTDALAAVNARDFQALADLAEFSCLKMHGLMIGSRPGLIYWNAATLSCLHAVRNLRQDGVDVFFTVDAGPQVKAVCPPEAERDVSAALASVPGVQEIVVTGLGPGARVVDP